MTREFDLVVAGGGTAGVSAGLTAARLGRSTLVVTGDVLGGQLVSIEKIDGYPGFPDGVPGYDFCPIVQEQALAAGAEFMMTTITRIEPWNGRWQLATGEGDVLARAIVIATGTTLKKLDVPGEERLAGKGVSHCATCDAPLFRGRIVAAVGGGDSAMQEALTLAEAAAKVIVVQRGNALTGQRFYCERVAGHPKIEIRFHTEVVEVLGETVVTGLRTRHSAGNTTQDVEVAAVFPYVGLQPNSQLIRDCVKLDPAGRIPVDAFMRSERAGICAAGNVRSCSPHRAATAAGDGATAALAADRYLTDGTWR
jgi:thioredoxin reductase (NADPH)